MLAYFEPNSNGWRRDEKGEILVVPIKEEPIFAAAGVNDAVTITAATKFNGRVYLLQGRLPFLFYTTYLPNDFVGEILYFAKFKLGCSFAAARTSNADIGDDKGTVSKDMLETR